MSPAVSQHGGYPVFAGVVKCTREGNDLWSEMAKSGIVDKVALVYGQMNEPLCPSCYW